MCEGLFYLYRRYFVILELAGEVFVIGDHVEMPVAGQIKEDDPLLSFFLGRQRLVDGHPNGVGALRRGMIPSVRAKVTAASKQAIWCTATASMSFWS